MHTKQTSRGARRRDTVKVRAPNEEIDHIGAKCKIYTGQRRNKWSGVHSTIPFDKHVLSKLRLSPGRRELFSTSCGQTDFATYSDVLSTATRRGTLCLRPLSMCQAPES